MPEINKPTKVVIIESERGYGQRIDEVKYFDNRAEALKFVDDFNADNDFEGGVPDWYMVAHIEHY